MWMFSVSFSPLGQKIEFGGGEDEKKPLKDLKIFGFVKQFSQCLWCFINQTTDRFIQKAAALFFISIRQNLEKSEYYRFGNKSRRSTLAMSDLFPWTIFQNRDALCFCSGIKPTGVIPQLTTFYSRLHWFLSLLQVSARKLKLEIIKTLYYFSFWRLYSSLLLPLCTCRSRQWSHSRDSEMTPTALITLSSMRKVTFTPMVSVFAGSRLWKLFLHFSAVWPPSEHEGWALLLHWEHWIMFCWIASWDISPQGTGRGIRGIVEVVWGHLAGKRQAGSTSVFQALTYYSAPWLCVHALETCICIPVAAAAAALCSFLPAFSDSRCVSIISRNGAKPK